MHSIAARASLALALTCGALLPQSALYGQSPVDQIFENVEWLGPDPTPEAPVPGGGARILATMSLVSVQGELMGLAFAEDTSGTPLASVGDTVIAFALPYRARGEPRMVDAPNMAPMTVVARRRLAVPPGQGASCGLMPSYPGWYYALSGDLSPLDLPDDEEWMPTIYAVRAPFSWQEPVEAPEAAAAVYRERHVEFARRIAEERVRAYRGGYSPELIRNWIMGEDGRAGADNLEFLSLRGPKGEMLAATSFRLNDDPSDHGEETQRTIIIDTDGNVIFSFPWELRIITAIDLDGDGVDEVLTTAGTIYWDGERWSGPEVLEPVWC